VIDHEPTRIGLPPAVSHQTKVTNNRATGGLNKWTYDTVAADTSASSYGPVKGTTIPAAHDVVPHHILADGESKPE
jgi:hypothetical protein